MDYPGFVHAYLRPLFCRGNGPFPLYDDGDELEAITHRRDRRSGKFKPKQPDDPPSGLLFDNLN